MTTLAETMLNAAELVSNVRRGTATGGSTSTLVDAGMDEQAEYWKDGALFVLDGDNEGLVAKVVSHADNTLTIGSTLAEAIADGDTYAVVEKQFPLEQLKAAVNRALVTVQVMNRDTVALNGEKQIALVGAADIRRVTDDGKVNHFWKEAGGLIEFASGKEPSGTVEIWYPVHLAAIDADDDVDPAVNLNWLQWAAAVNLWRWYLQRTGKDDSIAQEMLNEAKMAEAQHKKAVPLTSKDMQYAGW